MNMYQLLTGHAPKILGCVSCHKTKAPAGADYNKNKPLTKTSNNMKLFSKITNSPQRSYATNWVSEILSHAHFTASVTVIPRKGDDSGKISKAAAFTMVVLHWSKKKDHEKFLEIHKQQTNLQIK